MGSNPTIRSRKYQEPPRGLRWLMLILIFPLGVIGSTRVFGALSLGSNPEEEARCVAQVVNAHA